MKESIATMTTKGQLTVPIEVRRQLGLKAGDKVLFQFEGQEVKLVPAASRLAAGYQSLPPLDQPREWDEVEATVAEEQAEQYARQLREGRS